MVKKVLVVLTLMIFLATSAHAAINFGYSYNPRTGDREFDITLGNINKEADADPDYFVNDMSRTYNVPVKTISLMVSVDKMRFSDIFMALKISVLTKKPIEFVVGEYKKNQGKGWGVIAKELGIKPGSKEFHALKGDANVALTKVKGNSKKLAKTKGNSSNSTVALAVDTGKSEGNGKSDNPGKSGKKK